jgi:hypothetical protein
MGRVNVMRNWHVWQLLFLRWRIADLSTMNLMVFSAVNNVSVGSRCLFDFTSGHTWGSPVSLTGNRVLDPTGEWAIILDDVRQGGRLVVRGVYHERSTDSLTGLHLTDRCILTIDATRDPAKSALGSGPLENRGTVDNETLLRHLAPLRAARVWLPNASVPTKMTDLRIYRVMASGQSGAVVEFRAAP